MDFGIEKYISPFIENQFPDFYRTEGPNFIEFVKTYYEWLETTGQTIHEARNLFEYRDIDTTLNKFLVHFQQKYLYGIPFNVIVDKRLLIKYALDVYKSKGSIQGYKLLFRLMYNEDLEIYIPAYDILKPSDGTWKQPKYLELVNFGGINGWEGKTIYGTSSKTSATVESVIYESINQNETARIYIENIHPVGANFVNGETIVLIQDKANTEAIASGPLVTGSMSTLDIFYGGIDYNVGDILAVAHRDITNNDVISKGVEGKLIVTETMTGNGSLKFTVISGGTGFSTNSQIFIYNSDYDTTGTGATFSIQYLKDVFFAGAYNYDIILDYANLSLNSAAFGFPEDPSANISSVIGTTLRYEVEEFGTIKTLYKINGGNNYVDTPYIFVRNVIVGSKNLPGNVTYNTASKNVIGTGTSFTTYFANNDTIRLQANSANIEAGEFAIIRTVANDTHITLYGPPTMNSISGSGVRIAPYKNPTGAPIEDVKGYGRAAGQGVNPGANEKIVGYPLTGNSIVAEVKAIDSGKNYLESEEVEAYLYNSINPPEIIDGGVGYSNGDPLVFIGGSDSIYSQAKGHVLTDSNGSVIQVVMEKYGSGYKYAPKIAVLPSSQQQIVNTVVSGILTDVFYNRVSYLNIANTALSYSNGTVLTVHNGIENANIVFTTNSLGGFTSGNLTITNGGLFQNTFNANTVKITLSNTGTGNTNIGAFTPVFAPYLAAGYDNTDIIYLSGGLVDGYGTMITNATGGSLNITLVEPAIFPANATAYDVEIAIVNSTFGNTTAGNNSVLTMYPVLESVNAFVTNTVAVLSTSIREFNTDSVVRGRVVRSAIGRAPGYWSTTRSFLNSDKRIQDSDFYQDYSYQIRTARMLDDYKDIIYDTFHPAGVKLFGSFSDTDVVNSAINIIYDTETAIANTFVYLTIDATTPNVDTTQVTSDQII